MYSKSGFIFTFNRFWEIDSGANMEIEKQVLRFPSEKKYVVFPFFLNMNDRNKLKSKYGLEDVFCICSISVLVKRIIRGIFYRLNMTCPYYFLKPFHYPAWYKRKISRIAHKNNCDLVLCEYIWHADLIDALLKDQNIVSVIETHDLQSRFSEYSKKNSNGIVKFDVTLQDEMAIISKFDMVLAISRRDEEIFRQYFGDKVVYLPSVLTGESKDSTRMNKPKLSYNGNLRIGFLGSAAPFNIDAIKWIVDFVNQYNIPGVDYNIYGKVCGCINEHTLPECIKLHGLVEDLTEIYKHNDIMVNPTFQAGGIKTKNIEAFLYNTPIITTTIGSYGMESACDYGCMFIADSPEVFKKTIVELKENRNLIINASNKCESFMNDNFNSELFEIYLSRIKDSIREKVR